VFVLLTVASPTSVVTVTATVVVEVVVVWLLLLFGCYDCSSAAQTVVMIHTLWHLHTITAVVDTV